MTEVPVNQKEYLKKYLAIGKAPGEKRKKKKKPTGNRIQIIDDDADINFESNIINADPIVIDEDAPQIVAIIDERPPSMRIDEKTKNPLWQPIGSAENSNSGEQKQMITGFKIAPKSNDKPIVFSDQSPPRRKKHTSERNSSPPRKSRRDNTPPTDIVIKEERKSVSPPSRNAYSDDNSPHRKVERSASSQSQIDDNSPPRKKRWDSDSSPPRKNRETTRNQSRWQPKEEDTSPPRRSRHAEDSSPPRRNISRDDYSPPRRNRHGDDSTLKRKKHTNDNSPPRKYRHPKDTSPPRRSRSMNDNSPRRRIKHGNDVSPPRRNKHANNVSPSTRKRETTVGRRTPGNSPPRKYKKDDRNNTEERKAPSSSDETRSKKMEKTLDGKSAGLQNARELIEETRNFKTREETLFKGLSKDVSGENAETVHRERGTGKIRNLEEEEERQRQKREEEEKNKEKYAKWGRGLAQVENREQQVKEQLHEMSKPLARYADDEDLEKYLKEQEREGDPMLAYIRKKKKKKAADRGEVEKPLFEGEFMPNRYGIRPGHRWDGVDRSSGYEKKWFEVQNEKKAMLEESYKWSTEDM